MYKTYEHVLYQERYLSVVKYKRSEGVSSWSLFSRIIRFSKPFMGLHSYISLLAYPWIIFEAGKFCGVYDKEEEEGGLIF